MPLTELYGHEEIRARLAHSAATGALPASLLFFGPRGVGKQRLALWLGQLLLCERENPPCGACRSCEYCRNLTHPDLHWYFPRPRLKDADPDLEDVRDDYRAAIAERMESHGLYAPSPGSEGIYIATVRAIVQEAAMAPAMARRKVFVIGDAERMGLQVDAEYAANAFLKLLEEPSPKTTIIITSSEPGGLLPTIRSRTAALRVPLVSEESMRAFLTDPDVVSIIGETGPKAARDRLQTAAGAPGNLIGDDARARAIASARRLLDAASARQVSQRQAAAMSVGASGARGNFADILDALIVILAERMRAALHEGNTGRAIAISRASDLVGVARQRASGNVNPQLIMAGLLRDLAHALR